MINNTLFRPSRIRNNRKKFNPEGFDLAAALKAKENPVETVEDSTTVSERYVTAFNEFKPVELINPDSSSEKELVIKAVYKQVFGNAHLMDSERLTDAESQLGRGQISVLEFVRILAKSDRYRSLFFEKCTNLRAIELNFKHLLGRAPKDSAEVSEHIKILAEGGFEAEIDSYLDSDEYYANFGVNIVPYFRGYKTQVGTSLTSYTHSYQLITGASSSDKSTSITAAPQLNSALMGNEASEITGLTPLPAVKPTIDINVGNDSEFRDLELSSYKYKTGEYLSKPVTPSDWVQEYKAREAAATFPAARRSEPVKLYGGASGDETAVVIRAAYKQVFGNVHLLESQRSLTAESQLQNGSITVKEFVRQIAKSDAYRALFFENCSNVRSIELNFKHLLGRAPESCEEINTHTNNLLANGFDSEIDSYIDSDEYAENFGEDTVPYYVAYSSTTGKDVNGYNRIFELAKAESDSDRSVGDSIKGSQGSQIQKALFTEARQKQAVFFQFIPKTKGTPSIPSTFVPQNQYPLYNETSPTQVAIASKKQYQGMSPVEYVPGSSSEEVELVIKAAYKQVFGNAHIMESERLVTAESQLKQGNISVREFVRCLAKSEHYKSLFVYNCPRYRTHELNFKHLLGRAPDGYDETAFHSNILDNDGYDADIDSYLDSQEYQEAFGENIVPYYKGYVSQNGQSMLAYSNMFDLANNMSTSDKAAINANKGLQQQTINKTPVTVTTPVTDTVALIRKVLNLV